MSLFRFCQQKFLLLLIVFNALSSFLSSEALAMDLIARCQADPDRVFHAVRESAGSDATVAVVSSC